MNDRIALEKACKKLLESVMFYSNCFEARYHYGNALGIEKNSSDSPNRARVLLDDEDVKKAFKLVFGDQIDGR